MIETIFIPTVHRVDHQITYEHLPNKWKKRVVMVVQAWERPLYSYDCDYLVLPDTPEYHFENYYCLPRTRKLIYETGRNMKYCILDDDIQFCRRNQKYFGYKSNMEKSKRFCTEEDIDEMFSLFDAWLNIPNMTVCGCAQRENPPRNKFKSENTSITSAYWINGNNFSDILDDLDLTSVRVGEDVCFLLSLLTRGHKNRVTNEFVTYNHSNNRKMFSTIWNSQSYEKTLKDHKTLEKMFPNIYTILYDENGNRLEGGYKKQGKSRINWAKAYKPKPNLESFIHD